MDHCYKIVVKLVLYFIKLNKGSIYLPNPIKKCLKYDGGTCVYILGLLSWNLYIIQ